MARSWKKRIKKGTDEIHVDLPITPMLDMAFQLMAFFVFVFRPMAQEGQIAMQLPAAEGGATTMPLNPETDPFETPQEFRVLVTDTGGAVESLTFVDDTGRQALDIAPGSVLNKLKSFAVGDETQIKIKIEATEQLRYSELIRLMDECIKAGFSTVGVSPLTPERP